MLKAIVAKVNSFPTLSNSRVQNWRIALLFEDFEDRSDDGFTPGIGNLPVRGPVGHCTPRLRARAISESGK